MISSRQTPDAGPPRPCSLPCRDPAPPTQPGPVSQLAEDVASPPSKLTPASGHARPRSQSYQEKALPISRPTVEVKTWQLRTLLFPPGASTSFRIPQGPAASYLETAAWGSLHTRQGLSINQTIILVSSAYLATMLNQLSRI